MKMLISLLAFAILSSCNISTTPEEEPQVAPVEGTVSGKINNQKWMMSHATAHLIPGQPVQYRIQLIEKKMAKPCQYAPAFQDRFVKFTVEERLGVYDASDFTQGVLYFYNGKFDPSYNGKIHVMATDINKMVMKFELMENDQNYVGGSATLTKCF